MKPSNTGIDWLRLTTIPSRVADAISGNITEREFVTVCEWAAQFAIAKYRKEAKAEWQQELAAKLEKMLRDRTYTIEDEDFVEHRVVFERDFPRILSLINENDNAE